MLTNAPSFDWHLANLNNSVTLMLAYPAPNQGSSPSVSPTAMAAVVNCWTWSPNPGDRRR
ncbi:MAG: hypothetical protein VKM92_05950 [Cyanobacteriota bacterium]|nr:hypothetical protein [Cyanobacteriota bacterium]